MHNISENKLVEVPAPNVPDWWLSVRYLVEDACKHSGGRYTTDSVLSLLLARRMQLWSVINEPALNAIVLTELVIYPCLKECRIIVATGKDSSKWLHLIEEMENWAKLQGCQKLMVICRPGWEKGLKGYDYKKTHIQMEKDLGYVH